MRSIESRAGRARRPARGAVSGRGIGRRAATVVLAIFLLVSGATVLRAQAPAGYYDSVSTASASTLRQTLHEVIDDHTRHPYTSSTEVDTWDILTMADEDPSDPNRIIDVYKNASYVKGDFSYNREHTWPKSYGFPVDGDGNYPYTDCHQLFLSDATYNSERSNKPFRYCLSGCAEWVTDVNDGRGGGSGVYPGNSNWTEGQFSSGTWEAWDGRKGDVARAILYMDIRYEGGVHNVTGFAEPDLRLTDNDLVIDSYRTGSNEPVAYMGILSDLLQWHLQDPVDSREMHRNDVVYTFQGNRNPFIDHPEWVACLYQDVCSGGDTTAPAAPTGLVAVGGTGSVDLLWNASSENDLAGYHVYRATSAGGPYGRIDSQLVTTASFTDTAVTGGTTYYYVVTAVDTSSNESAVSAEASATPDGPPAGGGGTVILSEVFYDPSGTDTGLEWVELYNPGDTAVDLSGYSVGAGGLDYTYSLVQLSGSIAPGATYVVGGPTSSSANGNPAFDQAVDFNPDLQNSGTAGDGVALFDVPASQVTPSTVPVDAVVYGPNNNNGLIDETGSANAPEVADVSSGWSIERLDLAGSWDVQPAPTPNATPFGSGGGGGTGTVILSEVFYDPSGTDTGLEWVELYNPGGTAVDLSGYSVGAGGLDYTYSLVQLSGSIAPGATYVVGGPTSSSSNGNPSFDLAVDFNPDLQNSGTAGDGVALFDVPASQVTPSTVPVDAVVYGPNNNNGLIDETGSASGPDVVDVSSGWSIERVDLAGVWQAQATPTPNTTAIGGGGGSGPVQATTLHVASITVGTTGGGNPKAQATVAIVDDQGAPVADAVVTASFSGSYNESGSGATGPDGSLTFTTSGRSKTPSFTFCVDGVSHSSLGYDAAANAVTCSVY